MKYLDEVIIRASKYQNKARRNSDMDVIDSVFDAMRKADLKPGEPIFIIRGQDAAAPDAIRNYGMQAEHAGASVDFLAEVSRREQEFREWQRINESLVKIPD